MKAGSSGLNSSGAPSTTGGVMSFMAISLARTPWRRERTGSLGASAWTNQLRLLSPARGRGWVRGLHGLSMPPHLASPPSGGEELEPYRDGEENCFMPHERC